MVETVKTLFRQHFAQDPCETKRYTTGLANYVYRVTLGQDHYILRLSGSKNEQNNETFWIEALSSLDIPIPKILHKGEVEGKSYLILNHIEGEDLGHVYEDMDEDQKRVLAEKIIGIQEQVSSLPQAKGYGFLASYDDPTMKKSWKDIPLGDLNRSIGWMKETGYFPLAKAEAVIELLDHFDPYFETIEPRAFLDDITTKNVLVQGGKLSGIIDLDWMCFGDRLYFIALTQMSLLHSDRDLDYVKWLVHYQGLSPEEERVLTLYTLVFCVVFMSEKGMAFNKDLAPEVGQGEIDQLNALYDHLYKQVVDSL